MHGLPRWMGIALAASGAVIASQAQAQSLGGQLGSPTGEPAAPPNVAPVVPTIPPPPNGAPQAQPITVDPRTSQPSSTPPDLVLTHDGGMVRGTIVRSQPGRSVVIQLVTGEVHEIPWTEIRFAGPNDSAPAAEPEANANPYREPRRDDREEQRRRGREVPVQFVSDDRLTLHRLGGTATMSAGGWGFRVSGRSDYYERECTAPCELSVEPGVYQLALSIREYGPVRMGSFDITRPGTLRGTHVDNAGSRGVGAATLVLGLAAATPFVIFGAINMGSYYDREVGTGLFITGCVIGGLALLVGIPLAAMRSGLVLTFE